MMRRKTIEAEDAALATEHLYFKSKFGVWRGGEPSGVWPNRYDRLRGRLMDQVAATEEPVELSWREQRLVRSAAAFVLERQPLITRAIGLDELTAQTQLEHEGQERTRSREEVRDYALERMGELTEATAVLQYI